MLSDLVKGATVCTTVFENGLNFAYYVGLGKVSLHADMQAVLETRLLVQTSTSNNQRFLGPQSIQQLRQTRLDAPWTIIDSL